MLDNLIGAPRSYTHLPSIFPAKSDPLPIFSNCDNCDNGYMSSNVVQHLSHLRCVLVLLHAAPGIHT